MKKTIFASILLCALFLQSTPVFADFNEDATLHEKYELYLKYQKKKKYGKYKDYLEVKEKYGFGDAAKRIEYKDAYDKYRQFKKDPKKFYYYAKYLPQYKAYKKYKEVKEYSKYKNYKKYNKKKYDKGKKYGGAAYKAGHARYEAFTRDIENVTANAGPEVRVGLWSKNTTDAISDPFKLTANKPFNVTNCLGTVIGAIPVGDNARVTYVDTATDTLRAYNSNSLIPQTDVVDHVCFEAADGNSSDMIFDVNTPNNLSKGNYDHYRGKIKIQYSATNDNSALYNDEYFADWDPGTDTAKKRIWVINMLPLEQYLWGYGEMKADGNENHNKALIVAARSYVRWHREYGQRWKDFDASANDNKGEGFDLLAYPQSQIYKGYDYEIQYPLVAEAARKTNGVFMKYGSEYVLGAYSSNTDGNTRELTGFPYLLSVPDPYGKTDNPGPGNHMWGMSAAGSVVLANNYGWQWSRILSYYYSGISFMKEY